MLDEYFKYLEKLQKSQPESGATGQPIRISGIGLCQRKHIYKAHGYEKRQQGEAYKSFSLYIGTAVHEIVQDHLMDAGIIHNLRDKNGKPDEVTILRPDLRASGHVDGTYDIGKGKNKKLGVWELKTTNAMGFAMFAHYLKKPKKAHLEQCNTYAGFLGAEELTILYINTNGMVDTKFEEDFKKYDKNQRFLEFKLPFNPILFQQTLDKITSLHYYLDNHAITGELPPKVADNQCSYCEFKWTCKPEKAKKEISDKPPKEKKIITRF